MTALATARQPSMRITDITEATMMNDQWGKAWLRIPQILRPTTTTMSHATQPAGCSFAPSHLAAAMTT